MPNANGQTCTEKVQYVSDGYAREEQQERCFACNRFLTRSVREIYCPKGTDFGNMTPWQFVTKIMMDHGIQLKVWNETKCRSCKEINCKLIFA